MRKFLVLALVLLTMSLGSPGFAQSPRAAQAASVSGQAVDAGGGALLNQRVELVRDGEVIQTTTTGGRGEWSFTNVLPGEYIVRLTINDQVAGIRVAVTSSQTVANQMIVAPSAAVPSAAFLATLGAVGATIVVASIVTAIILTIVLATGS